MFNDEGRWHGVVKNEINEKLSKLTLDELDMISKIIDDTIKKQK